MMKALRTVVHGNATAKEAFEMFKELATGDK